MNERKAIGLAAGALAVGMLIAAFFSQSWISGLTFGTEHNVGLRSVELCDTEGGVCESIALTTWNESDYAPEGLSRYILLGRLSGGACLLTSAFLLALLAYAGMRKTPRWPVHPGTATILCSIALLFLGVLTLALHPFKATGWGTGPGFLLLAAGDISALVGGLFLGRSEPMSEDDWFQ